MTVRRALGAARERLTRRRAVRRFTGDYATWDEARAASRGYDDEAILEKVKQATLHVRAGDAAYERDSVVFDTIQYSWPVLAGLLWAASRSRNRLNVLDFGGSLGTSYRQNRQLLEHLDELRWNVVEQESYVRVGRELFQTEELRFYPSIDACASDTAPNVVLVSSSLAYVPQPYAVLDALLRHAFEYLIVDRTAFLPDRDRLTVQNVPPWIYDASYPAWFLHERRFLDAVDRVYDRVAEFDALEGSFDLGDATARSKGFIFERRAGLTSP